MLNHIHTGSVFRSDELRKIVSKNTYSHIVIISDSHVIALYGNDILKLMRTYHNKVDLIQFAAGEKNKNRQAKELLEDKLFELNCDRHTLLIALGGGVTTDLVGYVAATYKRGIDVIYIPTSLLAMVDASIGGKTGINTKYGKNSLGTFTDPKAVLIDSHFLKTLSNNDYKYAFSEIIKHAVIADYDYFKYLEAHIHEIQSRDPKCLQHIIQKSLEIKSKVVTQDKTEKGTRAILNYGHTAAHALEKLSNYTLHHGHAVAHGIMIENNFAVALNKLSHKTYNRIKTLLNNIHLLEPLPFDYNHMQLTKAMRTDKKNMGENILFTPIDSIGTLTSKFQLCPVPDHSYLLSDTD